MCGTAAVIGGLIIQFVRELKNGGSRITKVGYALLIGGGLNNLADRKQKGYVTDYFSFNVKWQKFSNLVFNLSDMFIFWADFWSVQGRSGKEIADGQQSALMF